MPRCFRLALCFALLALLLPALAPASSQATRKKAGKKAVSQPAEPVRPPLPQELPPVPPTVTFRGGQLSIVAPNSTLLDILTAVRSATGAAVDAPADAARERVATRLGPGRPREVLAALLDGSKFDYILLGSAQDPASVRRLILSPRSGGGAPATAGDSGSTSFARPTRPPVSTDTSEDENSQPEPAPEQTVEPAEEAPPEQPNAPAPEVKTPEQIQEEQRLQREHQQQEQQPPEEQQQ